MNLPLENSKWQNASGQVYTVLYVKNVYSDKNDYLPNIVYSDKKDDVNSMNLSQWQEVMSKID